MNQRKTRGTKTRKKPLIKRVLILGLQHAPTDNCNWGHVKCVVSEDEAIKLMMNYSYDAIIMPVKLDWEKVLDILTGKYLYDSVIVIYQEGSGSYTASPAGQRLKEAGYTVVECSNLSLLACKGEELIWEKHGKKAVCERMDI